MEQELEKVKAEKEALVPEGAAVVAEKDLVELHRYIDENPLFKYRLLTHFHQYKNDPKNRDIPALET